MKAGVPWDVAIELSPNETLGYLVAIGEMQGGKFDWRSLSWEQS